jgi:hypothetical protein
MMRSKSSIREDWKAAEKQQNRSVFKNAKQHEMLLHNNASKWSLGCIEGRVFTRRKRNANTIIHLTKTSMRTTVKALLITLPPTIGLSRKSAGYSCCCPGDWKVSFASDFIQILYATIICLQARSSTDDRCGQSKDASVGRKRNTTANPPFQTVLGRSLIVRLSAICCADCRHIVSTRSVCEKYTVDYSCSSIHSMGYS